MEGSDFHQSATTLCPSEAPGRCVAGPCGAGSAGGAFMRSTTWTSR